MTGEQPTPARFVLEVRFAAVERALLFLAGLFCIVVSAWDLGRAFWPID
jgi:hypothetical protein